MQSAGYGVERIPIFDDIETIDEFHQDMIAFEFAQEHENWFKENRTLYRPRTADLIRYGQTISRKRQDAGRKHRLTLRERLHKSMSEHQVDLWICPPAPDVAPEGIHATGSPAMNMPWTHSGLPSITVPAGTGDKGLPLGLQLCARFGDDERLLAWTQDISSLFQS